MKLSLIVLYVPEPLLDRAAAFYGDRAAGGPGRHGRCSGHIRSRLHRGAAGGDGRMSGPVYDNEDVHDDGQQWPDEEHDRD